MELVITIIILLIIGVSLVLAEVILPGGVVGSLGMACLVGGVIAAFYKDTGLGFGISIGVVIFFCISFYCWIKYLPKLPMAKEAFLNKTAKDWNGTDPKNVELLGKEGVTQTMLRPAGFVSIDDERIDVVSEGEMIERDTRVKVITIEGNRIVVARIEEDDPE